MELDRRFFLADAEYRQVNGEHHDVHCVSYKRWGDSKVTNVWTRDGATQPYDAERDILVCYNAAAELNAFRALGWAEFRNVLDLYVEHRVEANNTRIGYRLIDALSFHGLHSIGSAEKTAMRDLAIRGAPFTEAERQALMAYCATDVDALEALLPAMSPSIDVDRALWRGRYMAASAEMEWSGLPVDLDTYRRVKERWPDIKQLIVDDVNKGFDVYDGTTFKHARFVDYLVRHDIPWALSATGTRLNLQDNYFALQAMRYPALEPLRVVRRTLEQFRTLNLPIGSDGRNRPALRPFRAKTGRHGPSGWIFGASKWFRGFVQPHDGTAIAYIDYAKQEFGIAAALSQDPAMLEAYRSGQPYLAFAKLAGAVPADATNETHPVERAMFKRAALAVAYGQGYRSLADDLGITRRAAASLLQQHRMAFPRFWEWLEHWRDVADLEGRVTSLTGWSMIVDDHVGHRTVDNFWCQSNGCSMLQLAILALRDAGIRVVHPVHDAVVVEAPVAEIEEVAAETRRIMEDVGEQLLFGRLRIGTDVEIYRPGDRMLPHAGREMWDRVMGFVGV
jgi:DNA polymerase-1